MNANAPAIFVKHESGALHELKGKAFKALVKTVKAGLASEINKLMDNGYVGFLDDSGNVECFDALTFE